jgi:hypothetical protein
VEQETGDLRALLQTNTEMTEKIALLTAQLPTALCDNEGRPRPALLTPDR